MGAGLSGRAVAEPQRAITLHRCPSLQAGQTLINAEVVHRRCGWLCAWTCHTGQASEDRRAARQTYLRHQLALVRTDPLFADDAIARLHKASLGSPRAVNNAASAALIAAATAGKALVDDDCAKKSVAVDCD